MNATAPLDKSLLLDQANRLLRQLRTMADRSPDPGRRRVLRDAIVQVASVIRGWRRTCDRRPGSRDPRAVPNRDCVEWRGRPWLLAELDAAREERDTAYSLMNAAGKELQLARTDSRGLPLSGRRQGTACGRPTVNAERGEGQP